MAVPGHIAGGGLHAATPTGFCRLMTSMLGSGKRGLKRYLSDYKKLEALVVSQFNIAMPYNFPKFVQPQK